MKQKSTHLVLATLFILSILGLVFTLRYKQAQPLQPAPATYQPATKIIVSDIMKLRIEVPSEYSVEDKQIDLKLSKNDRWLNIGRVASMFDTVEGYVDNLARLNNLTFSGKQKIFIDRYPTIRAYIASGNRNSDDKLIYFIFADNWIFTAEASDPSLNTDLDRIVSSFKYLPDRPE